MTRRLSPRFIEELEHVYLPTRPRPTAREAAQKVKPVTGTKRLRVLEYIQDQGEHGATDDEIVVGIPMPANTVRPRRLELLELDLIKDSGLRRPTPFGNSAIVWVVT